MCSYFILSEPEPKKKPFYYKFGFGPGSEKSQFTSLSFLLTGILSLMMFDFQTWILAIFSPEKWNKSLLPNLYWQLLSHRWYWERARWPDAVPTEFREDTTRENRSQRVSWERAWILGAFLVGSDKGNRELLKQERLLEGIAKRQGTSGCENQSRGHVSPAVFFSSAM